MKKHGLIVFLCLILLVIPGCEKGSTDWVKFKTDQDGNRYSFSRRSIESDSERQRVKVLIKEVYSDVGKTVELQSRIKDGLTIQGYDNLSYKTSGYEIDCRKGKIAVLAINHYDQSGRIIYAGAETRDKQWYDIQPDTVGDALQRQVCPH
jgi:hypothetical protein